MDQKVLLEIRIHQLVQDLLGHCRILMRVFDQQHIVALAHRDIELTKQLGSSLFEITLTLKTRRNFFDTHIARNLKRKVHAGENLDLGLNDLIRLRGAWILTRLVRIDRTTLEHISHQELGIGCINRLAREMHPRSQQEAAQRERKNQHTAATQGIQNVIKSDCRGMIRLIMVWHGVLEGWN